MGKRTTGRARGRGNIQFRVRKQAYKYKISYPKLSSVGKAKIMRLINSSAHSTPLAKIKILQEEFCYISEKLRKGYFFIKKR